MYDKGLPTMSCDKKSKFLRFFQTLAALAKKRCPGLIEYYQGIKPCAEKKAAQT